MRVMVYKNVNRRVQLLAAAGYIEEIKQTGKSPHGRIEYRLTMKGVREVISSIFLLDPSGTGTLIDHIDRFQLDKNEFVAILIEMINERISDIDNLVGIIISLNQYDYKKLIGIIKKLKMLSQQVKELKEVR